MANNNSDKTITIDGVVITKSKNFYTLLGVGKLATSKEIDKQAYLKIGSILYGKYKDQAIVDALPDTEKDEIKKLTQAYKILSDEEIRNAYDIARKNNATNVAITVNGETVNASEDYYATLGVKSSAKKEELTEALTIKLGEHYLSSNEKDALVVNLSNPDQTKVSDLADAHKILSNESNKSFYDAWLKKSKVKVTSVKNGWFAAINGRKILIGLGCTVLAAAIIAGSYFGIKALTDKDKSDDLDKRPGYEQSIDEQNEKREFVDVNNKKEVQKRTEAIFASMEDNGIMFKLPNAEGTGERDLTQEDIMALIYWCNYPYLNDDNIEKACDMDTAAMLISQICANYEMKGQTSQRIAGITGLPTDPDAGKYDFDFGDFFIDGTIQQKTLSRVSAQNNQIKNNPSSESKDVATQMFKDATLHFTFDDTNMELYTAEYDTANFVYGMMMATSQSIFDLKPSFVYGDAVYNDYNTLVSLLNEIDGPINQLGRSIEKDMAIGMGLGFKPCE